VRITIDSHFFHPSVGGVEMMTEGLATAWQDFGHEVHITTSTPLNDNPELSSLTVTRSPDPAERLRLLDRADVFVRSGNSLRSLPWPVLTGTPCVTIHHRPLAAYYVGWGRCMIEKPTTYLGWNVAVSKPVAETIPGPTVHIPNTFRPVFDQPGASDAERSGLLFVGRLVTRKGIDIALKALQRLHERGIYETLTICGDGPEREGLEQMARQLGVEQQVQFEGWMSPEELAERYARSTLAVIPSRKEPFGIVALEAIASGCPVVASKVGGLPEAVGECGLLVEPETPAAMADAIETALQPEPRSLLFEAMPAHVERHRIDRIAEKYLTLLHSVVHGTDP